MALRKTNLRYSMTPAMLEVFQDIYVTRRMVNDPLNMSVLFETPYDWLQDIVGRLYQKDWVELKGNYFVPTALGREKVVVAENRFYDFLKMFDGFHSVNYATGTFAIASYLDMDDATYHAYINNNETYGWQDFRVAVAERKGLNPLEIVFMSFLKGKMFDTHPNGWQFAVASGEMWDEVVQVCTTAIHMDQLGDPERGITPEDDIDAIITAGSALFIQLMQRQAKEDAERAAQKAATATAEKVYTEVVETETTMYETVRYVERVEPVYYTPTYYRQYAVNPVYLSPVWYDSYW